MITVKHPVLGEMELSARADYSFSYRDSWLKESIERHIKRADELDGVRLHCSVTASNTEGIRINGKVYKQISYYADANRIQHAYPSAREQFTDKAREWFRDNISPWVKDQLAQHRDALIAQARQDLINRLDEELSEIEKRVSEARTALNRYQ